MQAPSNCPLCKSPIKLVPAGVSKKTGKPYNSFYACSNRDCGYVYREESGFKKAVSGNEEILKEVQAVNKRLDSMAQWLAEQFQGIIEMFDKK